MNQKLNPSRVEPRRVKVFLRGGLGNQLFSLAAAMRISKAIDAKVVASTAMLHAVANNSIAATNWDCQVSQIRGEVFSLDTRKHQPSKGTSGLSKVLTALEIAARAFPSMALRSGYVVAETLPRLDYECLREGDYTLLGLFLDSKSGFLASSEFRLQMDKLESSSDLHQLLKEEVVTKAPTMLHFRSGDYNNMRRVYGSLSRRYWALAANMIGRDREFWLFTDDENGESVANWLPLRVSRIVSSREPLTPMENLDLMRLGNGIISSNSTFSWWAAMLGAPDAPKVFPRPADARFQISDYLITEYGWKVVDC